MRKAARYPLYGSTPAGGAGAVARMRLWGINPVLLLPHSTRLSVRLGLMQFQAVCRASSRDARHFLFAAEAATNSRRCALIASLSSVRQANRNAVSEGPARKQKSHAIHTLSVWFPRQCTNLLPDLVYGKRRDNAITSEEETTGWTRPSMLFGA
jgi:hypothetical protein